MIALIVIDMQKGMFSADTPRFNAQSVIERINVLADMVRTEQGVVIFIQHDGPPGDVYEPETDGWQLLPVLQKRESDPVVHKTTCDAFYHTELEELLTRLQCRTVIITGCATDFCVDTTVRAALSKDLDVIVVRDGHTTADRPGLKAKSVIDHHNWVWQNLVLPRHNIQVLTAEEVAREITRS